MVDSFGGRMPEAVRDRARAKILHAERTGRRLSADTAQWWAAAPVRLELRRANESSLELVAHTDPLPPVDEWWLNANDALQNLRAALDQLHHAIWLHIVGTQPGKVYFPLFMSGGDFRSWRRVHEEVGFPRELIERYRAVQPYVTDQPELRALCDLTNAEKHRDGVMAAVDLHSLQVGLRAELGHANPALGEEITNTMRAGEVVDPLLDRAEAVLIRMPWRHDVMPTIADIDFSFTTSINIDGDAVPLSDVMPRLIGATAGAVAYVSELTDEFGPIELSHL